MKLIRLDSGAYVAPDAVESVEVNRASPGLIVRMKSGIEHKVIGPTCGTEYADQERIVREINTSLAAGSEA